MLPKRVNLALRNILRKKTQSFLIFISSVVASYTIFIQIAQKNSVEENLKTCISEALSGQYIIYDSDKPINILESQFANLKLFEWKKEDSVSLCSANSKIASIAPRLRFGGLLAFGDETTGLNFQAITPEHIKRMVTILDFKEGNIPLSSDEIILSEIIADNLKCKVGDTLVVLANNKDGYLNDALVRVSGIFSKKGIGQFLIPIAYVPHAKGAEILGTEETEHMELIVNYHNFEDGSAQANMLGTTISKKFPELKLADWQSSAPLLNSIVDIWKGFGILIQSTFMIFSFLILVNIVIMMTNHRKKEIGTLLAIGFTPGWIINSIAIEYLLLTLSGSLMVGLLMIFAFSFLPENGIEIPWEAMQVAYLSHHLKPRLFASDILLICSLFAVTNYLAVRISLRKLKNQEVTTLLLSHT